MTKNGSRRVCRLGRRNTDPTVWKNPEVLLKKSESRGLDRESTILRMRLISKSSLERKSFSSEAGCSVGCDSASVDADGSVDSEGGISLESAG